VNGAENRRSIVSRCHRYSERDGRVFAHGRTPV